MLRGCLGAQDASIQSTCHPKIPQRPNVICIHSITVYMSLSSDFVFVHVQYMCLNQVISKKLGWYGNAGLVSSRSLVRGPFSLESPLRPWLRFTYI